MLDSTASMIQYRITGGGSVFPIPFPFQETAHIHAHVSEGMATRRLNPGVDFTVSRNSDATGELVLLGDVLPAGQLLTLRRLLPLTQEILFHNQGPNSPQAIEEAVDKLTMISQQLQAAVDTCLQAPDAETAADLAGAAAANAERVAAVEQGLAAKADRNHAHTRSEIPGLDAALAAKADAAATTQALAGKAALSQLAAKADLAALAGKADRGELSAKADASLLALKADKSALADKADRSELAGKAGSVHSHAIDTVNGLAAALAAKAGSVHSHGIDTVDGLDAALAAKLNADDPRLDLIGSGGNGGGGTTDHARLDNRDAPGQHPQSAVTGLTTDLSAIRSGLSALEQADAEFADHVEELAVRTDELFAGAAANSSRADAFAVRLGNAEAGIASGGADIAALAARMTAAETNVAGSRADVTGIRADLTAAQSDVTTVRTDVREAEGSLASLAAELERLAARLGALEDAPGGAGGPGGSDNGGGGGTPGQGGAGGSGGGFIGDIRLLPFRADAMPAGWHFCGGAELPLSSAAGKALASLPESYRTDWGIIVDGDSATLPDLFDKETGAGLFLRAVEGGYRRPGSLQGDAIRNITASFAFSAITGPVAMTGAAAGIVTGAFTTQNPPTRQYTASATNVGQARVSDLLFDASRVVPTDAENRPLNIGMTPAIYLGA